MVFARHRSFFGFIILRFEKALIAFLGIPTCLREDGVRKPLENSGVAKQEIHDIAESPLAGVPGLGSSQTRLLYIRS